MKWAETTASKCRYGEVAGTIWGDWDVVWEDSEADYQGHAKFLAEKDGKYCFYEWWYGSCSGCDGWEAADASDDEIATEMRNSALWLNSQDELRRWLDMLEGNPRSNASRIRGRIDAIRKLFGMDPLP